MISGPPMMVLTVAYASVKGVLGGAPNDIAVSPELSFIDLRYSFHYYYY